MQRRSLHCDRDCSLAWLLPQSVARHPPHQPRLLIPLPLLRRTLGPRLRPRRFRVRHVVGRVGITAEQAPRAFALQRRKRASLWASRPWRCREDLRTLSTIKVMICNWERQGAKWLLNVDRGRARDGSLSDGRFLGRRIGHGHETVAELIRGQGRAWKVHVIAALSLQIVDMWLAGIYL